MKRSLVCLVSALAVISLAISGCTQSASTPPPAPTSAPKAAQPTAAAPIAVPAAPTAGPGKVGFQPAGKNFSLIIPYGAGGATDMAGRLLALLLEKELGAQFQILNKVGAASQVGLTEMLSAKPDGYTMSAFVLPAVIMSYMDPARKAVYNRQSFYPLGNHVVDPMSVTVRSDSPYKTMKDLIDAAKAKPGKISVGTTGPQGTGHLSLLELQKTTGTELALVHFETGKENYTALMGRHVEVSVDNSTDNVPLVKSGDLRLLGIMDKQESPFHPGAPSLESQGYPINWTAVRGYVVNSQVPREALDVLVPAFKKAINDPAHVSKLLEANQVVRYQRPEEVMSLWDDMESRLKPMSETLFKLK